MCSGCVVVHSAVGCVVDGCHFVAGMVHVVCRSCGVGEEW